MLFLAIQSKPWSHKDAVFGFKTCSRKQDTFYQERGWGFGISVFRCFSIYWHYSLCNGNAGATYNFRKTKIDKRKQKQTIKQIINVKADDGGEYHKKKVNRTLPESSFARVCVFCLRKIDRKRMTEKRCLFVSVVHRKKEDERERDSTSQGGKTLLRFGFFPQAALDPRFPRRHPAQMHPQTVSFGPPQPTDLQNNKFTHSTMD